MMKLLCVKSTVFVFVDLSIELQHKGWALRAGESDTMSTHLSLLQSRPVSPWNSLGP